MELTDAGSPGVWRRKKPDPVQEPILNLSEPQPEALLPSSEPSSTEAAMPEKEAAPTTKTQPSEAPSSSKVAPSQPQEPATLEEIRTQLADMQSLIIDGFTNVHQCLTMQHTRLEKMDEQIKGIRFALGFSDANIALLLRQHREQQKQAEEEAKKKSSSNKRRKKKKRKLKKPKQPTVQS